MSEPLFYNSELSQALENVKARIQPKVDQIAEEQFLVSSDDDVFQHILPMLTIEPLTIYEDRKTADYSDVNHTYSGHSIRFQYGANGSVTLPSVQAVVSIPFTGDPKLWQLRTDTWRSTFPYAEIKPPDKEGVGTVLVTIIRPTSEDASSIERSLKSTLDDIRFYLGHQASQVSRFNASLEGNIRSAIARRRERLGKRQEIAKQLNIPLRPKSGVPPVTPIQVKKVLPRPLPSPPKAGQQPEPGIATDVYEHILAVIRQEGLTFESSPQTFKDMGEEALRSVILAHLNGHYEGGATGETFRKKGKTDIRIEEKNRAAFVAECKVWKGSKEVGEACDQLLGYLTWRDSKAALVIFNKHNAKFSEVRAKLPDGLRSHSLFKRDIGSQHAGEWRFEFRSSEDEDHLVTVHIFAFNLYCAR